MSFSDTFLDIMQSLIRPKCEPKITVTGTAADGTTKTIEWDANNIQSLTFHRSIDPVGRELPVMELQWTEVYYGKFDTQNFPIKYNNAAKYMAVNLEFRQYLGFYQTWKTLKSLTWKQVKKMTWKQVKNEVAYETVKMPMMFLSATPEISGHTIKWTAKDALSFLTEKQVMGFGIDYDTATKYRMPFYNPVVWLLTNARATFLWNKELFEYYTRTIEYFNSLEAESGLYGGQLFEDATNGEIMNYLSVRNEYLDFDDNKIIKKSFTGRSETTTVNVPLSLQYGTPTSEFTTSMSQYNFKQYDYTHTIREQIAPYKSEKIGDKYKNTYQFKKYGRRFAVSEYMPVGYNDVTHAILITDSQDYLYAYQPIEFKAVNERAITLYETLQDGTTRIRHGEPYNEDNHSTPYWGLQSNETRARFLGRWFSLENHVIKNETPALFNWDIGEWANVETQMWKDNKNYVAKSQLLEYTLTYNGALKRSNVAHEVV